MKFPKHRADLFLVERWTYSNTATVIVGGFNDIDDAFNFKDACEQEWRDKGFEEELDKEEVVFNVVVTTYYG